MRPSLPIVAVAVVAALACRCGGGGGGPSDDADASLDTAADTLADPTADPPADPQSDTAGDPSWEDPAPDTEEDPVSAIHEEDGTGPAIWHPAPGTSWQIQFSGTPVDTSLDVTMYDIDLFDTPDGTFEALRADGRIVVCYFSAGSWEDWRDDRDDFPAAALGNDLDGWPGERWLDTRDPTVREIMRARLDVAVARGCDGVDPDNMDGYTNDPGFPLDYDTQLDYNRFIAAEAHARGLGVGLKNDLDQIGDLVDDFDWQLNEECFDYVECDAVLPFVEAGKAVFQIEYGGAGLAATICPQANAMDLDTLIKNLDLDAWRIPCRGP
mgnify:CR=1 FL=1